ncbi:putative bifunctional purine ADE1 [Naviculisporaceae sp. PSN 640]
MSLRILLIGNGGREHALAWKLSQSPKVESIIAVPGNGGTAGLPKVTNNTSVAADDYPALVELALKERINLVVPGPEAPLVDGVEGYFRDVRIPVFGPSKEAARMEGSKTFSKDFMKKHNIPTAAYENFSDYARASEYLKSVKHNVVIKATGLAAGKGVIIPETQEEAQQGLKEIMLDNAFGSAGDEVVIEEFLTGDELSILSFCDGKTIKSLPPAQDHKRIGEGDTGLNTGGMGCYAPTKIATPELIARIEKEILQPTIDGMAADGFPFKGCLFTGLMIGPDGSPKVLEYNVRFGDPETQTVLPLLESDLADIMGACAGEFPLLEHVPVKVSNQFSATVVVAAPGYPNSYPKNIPMEVAAPSDSTINIFHAGTKLSDNKLSTSGGRVIAAQAVGPSLRAAVDKAYTSGIPLINFEGMYFRKDIAHRAFRPSAATEKLTYAQSGVSIDAGNSLVERIKKAVSTTRRPGADAIIGGFGGEVDLSQAGHPNAPIIVGAIDGVGTKLIIAQKMNKHDTVGIDLVAMNVNDLVVQGAEPFMFLDYYGCSKLDVNVAASFVEGVAEGCKLSGCALVGGETAEMPDLYTGDDYDAAGAAIGVMKAEQRLPRKSDMVPGDVLIGLGSSGVHSNGFSLVRKVVDKRGVRYTDSCPWEEGKTVGEALLTPTKIYVKSLLNVLEKEQGAVKGMAHITGGGLTENVPRMLPDELAAEIEVGSWEVPGVFRWLRESVEPKEMARTFNNGVGMVLAVEEGRVEGVKKVLEESGEKVWVIGRLKSKEAGEEGCVLKGLEAWAA